MEKFKIKCFCKVNLFLRITKKINKNYHVIVDKPITISLKQVKELIKIARKKNLLISEATLFNYHRVFDKMLNLCGGTKKIIHIQSNFNVPLVKNVNKLLKNKKI